MELGVVMAALAVYPRVCGGTTMDADPSAWTIGLSPRVRGNLLLPVHRHRAGGSIPACAGEPAGRPGR